MEGNKAKHSSSLARRGLHRCVFPQNVCGLWVEWAGLLFCVLFTRLDVINRVLHPGAGLCLHLRYGYLYSMRSASTVGN